MLPTLRWTLCCFVMFSFARLEVRAQNEIRPVALVDVTLIDGTGAAARPGMTVLVDGETIAAVFATGDRSLPASAHVRDMSGRFVIPGLINAHLHLAMLGSTRDSVAEGLERMLHAGVTTIREMAGDARLSAGLVRTALIEQAPFPAIHYAVRMAGPTLYEGGSGARDAPGYVPGTAPWAQAIAADTDIALAVARAAGTGATGVKIYADLDTAVVRRIVEEAHRQGLKAWAHGTVFPGGPLEAVRAGIDGLSHACMLFWGLQTAVPRRRADARPFDSDPAQLSGEPFQNLVREMRTRGVVMDATARNASRNPGPRRAGCTPELLTATLRAMHASGVPISTGTDFYIGEGEPDPTLFQEIEYLVASGVLSPLEAITAATLNGARAIGIESSHGTIEPGKAADLVVLSADPTAGIGALRDVVAVMKAGRLYERSNRRNGDIVEGDSNRIEMRSATERVRDPGSGTDVTVGAVEPNVGDAVVAPRISQEIPLADSIRALAVESMRLWNRLDPDAWLALFADSARWYYHATSLDRTGVETMVRGLMSLIRDSRYRLVSEPDVVILGPHAAVASFAMIQDASAGDGIELDESTGLTFVYQRRRGDWRIIRVHESIEPPPDSVITERILAKSRELAAAWERLDADAYLAHFSDDLVFYVDGARVSSGDFEEAVRSAIASLRSSTFEILEPEVEVLGPDAAAISFALEEVMVDAAGTTTELTGVITLVWERRQGRWFVVRAHESLRRPGRGPSAAMPVGRSAVAAWHPFRGQILQPFDPDGGRLAGR